MEQITIYNDSDKFLVDTELLCQYEYFSAVIETKKLIRNDTQTIYIPHESDTLNTFIKYICGNHELKHNMNDLELEDYVCADDYIIHILKYFYVHGLYDEEKDEYDKGMSYKLLEIINKHKCLDKLFDGVFAYEYLEFLIKHIKNNPLCIHYDMNDEMDKLDKFFDDFSIKMFADIMNVYFDKLLSKKIISPIGHLSIEWNIPSERETHLFIRLCYAASKNVGLDLVEMMRLDIGDKVINFDENALYEYCEYVKSLRDRYICDKYNKSLYILIRIMVKKMAGPRGPTGPGPIDSILRLGK